MLRKVMGDFTALKAVLRGSAMLTPQLNTLARALLQRETPLAWQKLWDGPEDAMTWCRLVVSKTLALGGYTTAAQDGVLTQKDINLNTFFRPHTFFNALRQKTARLMGVSMDSLVFQSRWDDGAVQHAPLSCRIVGLGVQGCSFDGQRLHQADRDTPTMVTVPAATVGFAPKELVESQQDNLLELPLYASPLREKVVARLTVPCPGSQAQWILAGVALFLT
jgi:dynein heavy chain 2